MLFSERLELAKKIDHFIKENNIKPDTFGVVCVLQMWKMLAIPIEPPVKPAKNVKDFDWLDSKLNDILAQLEHKHITKEGAKDLLFEFIFEDLVNQIQELKDSSLSV